MTLAAVIIVAKALQFLKGFSAPVSAPAEPFQFPKRYYFANLKLTRNGIHDLPVAFHKTLHRSSWSKGIYGNSDEGYYLSFIPNSDRDLTKISGSFEKTYGFEALLKQCVLSMNDEGKLVIKDK